MELPEKGSVGDLVVYRIETAKSDLQSAIILLEAGDYRGKIIELIIQSIMQYLPFMH